MSNNCHLGSDFDDFLEQEGILNEVTEIALKRVLAWKVEQAIKERGLTKSKMAARAVGKRIKINLVDVV
jgi:antitoxin HicB